MASDSDSAHSQIRSIFESIVSSTNRDLSLFLPLIFGIQGSDPDETSPERENMVLINPFTQGMVVIEGASLSSLLRSDPEKSGRPPASKASIESLPTADIGEFEVGECAICLEDWGFGARVVKEMPCKHKFHGDCVEKWLCIHGSCPVCRFEMPVDQEEEKKKNGGETAVLVGFTLGSMNPDRSSSGGDADHDDGRLIKFHGAYLLSAHTQKSRTGLVSRFQNLDPLIPSHHHQRGHWISPRRFHQSGPIQNPQTLNSKHQIILINNSPNITPTMVMVKRPYILLAILPSIILPRHHVTIPPRPREHSH